MNRGITYGAMLALGEQELADTFPLGAIAEGNRWRPAQEDEEPGLTRDDLLKRRKELEEHPRLLARDSTRGYTEDPHFALHMEPEAVDKPTQDRYSEVGRERFKALRGGEHERRLAQQESLERQLTETIAIAQERGVDMHADIQFIRRRLDRMKQKLADAA